MSQRNVLLAMGVSSLCKHNSHALQPFTLLIFLFPLFIHSLDIVAEDGTIVVEIVVRMAHATTAAVENPQPEATPIFMYDFII